MVKSAIYLDANASYPLRPAVQKVLKQLIEERFFALQPNPSSIHSHGRRVQAELSKARSQIAHSVGERDASRITLTSSGSEANQTIIRSVLEPKLRSREIPHWIVCATNHDSTLQLIEEYRRRGVDISVLPVNERGIADIQQLEQLLRPNTALFSLAWVNNETGVIQPIAALLKELRRFPGISFHLDAAQAWGKLPIDLRTLGVSWASFSGHKIGALSGTGFIWSAPGARLEFPLIFGKQEQGLRGGTENLWGTVAAGVAASELDPVSWAEKMAPLRNELEAGVLERIKGAAVNGCDAPRVANTLSLSFSGIKGESLVIGLDLEGYSVSAGSACSSGALEPSHVLLAMGRSREEALASIRVSLHEGIERQHLEGFIHALSKVVSRIRK